MKNDGGSEVTGAKIVQLMQLVEETKTDLGKESADLRRLTAEVEELRAELAGQKTAGQNKDDRISELVKKLEQSEELLEKERRELHNDLETIKGVMGQEGEEAQARIAELVHTLEEAEGRLERETKRMEREVEELRKVGGVRPGRGNVVHNIFNFIFPHFLQLPSQTEGEQVK